MPVIGHATDNGHLSFIYKLGQNDFLRTIADAVHAAHPFHLVGGFERFGHIFLPCHIGNDDCHTLVAGLVGWKIAVEKGGLVKLRFPEYPMFYSIFYNCKFTSMFSSLIVFSSVFL